jgi:hypothetical protein
MIQGSDDLVEHILLRLEIYCPTWWDNHSSGGLILRAWESGLVRHADLIHSIHGIDDMISPLVAIVVG